MEEKIEIGAKAAEDVVCGNCHKTILGSEAHCFRDKQNNDIYMCDDCKKLIDAALKKETDNPNYIGALILGILAGIASGAVWYFIEILTGRIIGYVALAVGFIVGWAIVLGSGKKRGVGLQIISVIITIASIFGASYFAAIHFINDYISKEVTGGALKDYLWVSPFNGDMLKMLISPMGLVIWAAGIYLAFRIPKARNL